MSIYQCDDCGCSENTACGWYHARNNERLTPINYLGKALCSACAPTKWPNGEHNNFFTKEWHGLFDRTFLPHGEFKTNGDGNIEHIKSGLIGNEAYKKFGRTEPYPK